MLEELLFDQKNVHVKTHQYTVNMQKTFLRRSAAVVYIQLSDSFIYYEFVFIKFKSSKSKIKPSYKKFNQQEKMEEKHHIGFSIETKPYLFENGVFYL